MPKKLLSEADAKAWKHAIASGRFQMLSEEQAERAALIACYTRQEIEGKENGVSSAEMDALFEWCERTQLNHALFENLMDGKVFVHLKPGEKDPSFQLSPKGTAEAIQIGREMGLPVPDEDDL